MTSSFEKLTRKLAPIYRQMGSHTYGIVYLLTNLDAYKQYVGQTTQIIRYRRHWAHMRAARIGKRGIIKNTCPLCVVSIT